MFKVELHDPQTLRWWYEQHLEGRIDMSPAYQRKALVWNKWKRAHLIDSLLNDFDVPKFYVADFSAPSEGLKNPLRRRYAIIDGKQRLGAIFGFFSDEFPLSLSTVAYDLPEAKLGKLFYSDLKNRFPLLARKVETFQATVMNVATDDEKRIEQLFVRLNMGEATTGAERRNAIGGPVPLLVRELSSHPFFTRKIKFDVRRMQEHNLVIKLLLFEFKQSFADTKAKNLDDFALAADKWNKSRPEDGKDALGPYDEARDRVYDVLENLTSEFMDKDPLLSRAGEIPIYYWLARKRQNHVNELRDFVQAFSERLLENLRSQRDDPSSADSELSTYYTMSRTSNDQGSMEGRFKIFDRRFAEFIRPGSRRRI